MKSLRARLIALTLAAVAATWLVTAFLTWRAAQHEIEELLWDHPVAERREISREIAEHLLQPMLVALPVLGLLLAAAIGIALRPLRAVADAVAARDPDHLEPLHLVRVPREIEPLLKRLNNLFDGIRRALDNERHFTADAAHELRTPLAALKAQAQVAQAAGDDAERRHALQQILAGCDRATHLVEQLLTLARLDSAPVAPAQPVDLAALAAEVLAECAGEALARSDHLALDAPRPVPVAVPSALLRLLLGNLVHNAIRHTPNGTRIEVAVTTGDTGARLSVTDDGPGIPPGERGRVTQRFHRLGSSGTGTGLGLAIVAGVATAIGARLAIDSRVGPGGAADAPGTTVSVHFPAHDPR